jgi:hypothetical protein
MKNALILFCALMLFSTAANAYDPTVKKTPVAVVYTCNVIVGGDDDNSQFEVHLTIQNNKVIDLDVKLHEDGKEYSKSMRYDNIKVSGTLKVIKWTGTYHRQRNSTETITFESVPQLPPVNGAPKMKYQERINNDLPHMGALCEKKE